MSFHVDLERIVNTLCETINNLKHIKQRIYFRNYYRKNRGKTRHKIRKVKLPQHIVRHKHGYELQFT